jgi:hypothetical protein
MRNTPLTLTCSSQRHARTNEVKSPSLLSIQNQIWGFFCVQSSTAVSTQEKAEWATPYANDLTFKSLQASTEHQREELLSVTFMDVSSRVIRADIYPDSEQVFLGTLGQYDAETGRAYMGYVGTSTLAAFFGYLERIPNLHDILDAS